MMHKGLTVFACVLLVIQQGFSEDLSVEDTKSQELLGSVGCVVTENGITVCNQKIRTAKKKQDQGVKENHVPKDDETPGFLDAITEFMNDGIRFFEGESDKNNKNEDDEDYNNEDVADDGYDEFNKKGENDDDDYDDDDYKDDDYDDDKDEYDDDDDDDDDGDYREDSENDVDNSNRTSVKNRSKRQTSVQGNEGKRRRKKKNVLMKLFMIGMFLKSKLSTILTIFGTFMQLKFFGIAILNLIVGIIRLYLDMTRRGNQPHKVIYYEQAHHEHVYDEKHEDKGWLSGWLSKQDQVDPQELAYNAQVPH